MITRQEKLAQSRDRVNEAVEKIFDQNDNFTGQLEFEVHCKDGIVVDVYEIRRRRKV